MAVTLTAGARELPELNGVSYFDARTGSFVKAGQHPLPTVAKVEDEFMVVMAPATDQSRQALYELKRNNGNRDTYTAPVMQSGEIESLISRFKKIAARFNWKK